MSEFNFKKYDTSSNRAVTYKVEQQERALTFKEVIALLVNSSSFRVELTNTLKQSEFDGFFWEVKPCSLETLEDEFEFVTVYGKRISEIKMDSEPFKEHFNDVQTTLSFKNLRGDARLIVPNNINSECNYAHFVSFLRTAKDQEIDDFWKVIGTIYGQELNDQPIWLSTAGLGVHWLHVRIDKRPKYYRYEPFKRFKNVV